MNTSRLHFTRSQELRIITGARYADFVLETRTNGNDFNNSVSVAMALAMIQALDERDTDMTCLIQSYATLNSKSQLQIRKIKLTGTRTEARNGRTVYNLDYLLPAMPLEQISAPIGSVEHTFTNDGEETTYYIPVREDEAPVMGTPGYSDQPDLRSEHARIMVPQNSMEGIFGIAEHLGEGQDIKQIRCEIPGKLYGLDLGQRLISKQGGLNQLDRIIYDEAGMTAQGKACLPHENRQPTKWWKHAGGIRHKYNCTIEQATQLADAWKTLDATATMVATFDKWVSRGIEAACAYFSALGAELKAVAPEAEQLDLITYEEADSTEDALDADHPVDIQTIQADAWHLLDDPRDDMPAWETRQPYRFQTVLGMIRQADAGQLTAWAKSQYSSKPEWQGVQAQVLWSAYKARKAGFVTGKGKRIIERCRLTDNKAKARFWLYNKGGTVLNSVELTEAWKAIGKESRQKKGCQKIINTSQCNTCDVRLCSHREAAYKAVPIPEYPE